MAIESNQDSTLIFEEPESHAFPYYTKFLGEKIAMDETNQYFIATHNPYLLESIVAKTKIDDINVVVTFFDEYQTKVKCLSSEEISELLDADPFFNLELFVEK
jgi:AAA15 family ATPase/GTPase